MNLARVDLNLLLAFEALYEARSVGRAALSLGVRQPAMSAALGRLRALLGDELFVRAGGEMRPTAKAQRLAPRVAGILAELRAALADETDFRPEASTASFTVALSDYIAAVLGPPLVEAVTRLAPSVDFRVVGYEKGDVGDMVARGLVDVAVGVFPDPPPRLVAKPLYVDGFVGIARVGHPALTPGLDVAAYAALPHALVTLSRDATGAIDAALAAVGLRRRVALTLPHALALPAILACTDMVAAVPAMLAKDICGDRLGTFDIPLVLSPWRVDMLWSPEARSDPATGWLRSRITAAGAALDPRGGRQRSRR